MGYKKVKQNLDEIFGLDPEKVEFEFYCVMVARFAYEYFLKELAGKYYNSVDGNKITLRKMRNLSFETGKCPSAYNDFV